MKEDLKKAIEELQLQKINSKKEFSVLNEIREDPNFISFYERFFLLKMQSNDNKIAEYEKEDDYGNVEYKLKLADPSYDRVEHLTTQMKFRL
mmetsp:Transcript_14613/g.10522  ORF Transcript_14613/g.10522 Transcript_14613/m.10522 type:complete len:92 (+) Transcript_14613:272-547(+)